MFQKSIFLLSILAYSYAAFNGTVKDENAIIGGEKVTDDSSYPYHVSIQQSYLNKTYHRCDGVLINESWILSSASCELPIYTDLYVKVGSRYHNEPPSSYYPHMIKVQKIIVHPRFNNTIKELNNIVLLKVEKPFDLSSYIKLAELPSEFDANPVGQTFVTTSWGSGDASIANVTNLTPLYKLDITVIDNYICKKHISSLVRGPVPILPSHLCAGKLSPGVAVCSKASGSPLVTKEEYPSYKTVLIGIFSWGLLPCANSTGVGVYTNVLHHIDWIQATMLYN